jgi:hypothetical protein
VAGEVGRVAPVAEDAEEGDDHRVVGARVAGFPERALVLVAAPEDGEVSSVLPAAAGPARTSSSAATKVSCIGIGIGSKRGGWRRRRNVAME